MGKAGPSRTPKDILKMRGSWLANSRGNEPKSERAPKSPLCPRRLSAEAKKVWKEVVKQLGIMGILQIADMRMVARYCQQYVRWQRAYDFVMENGEGWPDMRDGKIVGVHKYPQTTVASQLSSDLHKFEDRLGLSPGARAGLAIENKGALSHEPEHKAKYFRAG